MPLPFPLHNRRLLAMWRIELIRRMLLIRHFTEHGAAVPIAGRYVPFRAGEEAVGAGIWAALGFADVLYTAGDETLPDAGPQPDTVVVWLRRDDDRKAGSWIATTRRRRLRLLLCQQYADGSSRCPGTVDGQDVEAVWAAVRGKLGTVRTAGRPTTLDVDVGALADADPVAVLAGRMYADRQLDCNALQAIDSRTAARVDTLVGLRHPDRAPGGLPGREVGRQLPTAAADSLPAGRPHGPAARRSDPVRWPDG